jgi:hypothetical protein
VKEIENAKLEIIPSNRWGTLRQRELKEDILKTNQRRGFSELDV